MSSELVYPHDVVPLAEKYERIAKVRNEVSDLQEALDALTSSAGSHILSRALEERVIPYPPIVKFKNRLSLRMPRHKLLGLDAYFQGSQSAGALATVSQDGTAILWDAETGLKYESFKVGRGSMMSLAVNPGGSVLSAGGLSCAVDIYSISSQLRELTSDPQAPFLFPSSSPHVREPRLDDAGRATQYQFSLTAHDAAVSALKFLDRGTLVSASQDGGLYIWDLTDKQVIMSTHDHVPINSVDSTISNLLCVAQGNGTLKICDLRSRDCEAQRFSSPNALSSARFMPEGRSVLASEQSGLRLFDLRSNFTLEQYSSKLGPLSGFDISPSGRLAIIGLETGASLALDLLQNRWFPPFDKRKDRISGVRILQGMAYVSSWDGTLRSYSYIQ